METTKISPVNGLKLIRTSNVLRVVSTCIAIVSMMVIMSGIGVDLESGFENITSITPAVAIAAVVGFLGTIGGLILLVISGIMEIVGLSKTSRAHASYKTAMLLVVASIAVSVITSLITQSEIVGNILSAITPALSALVVYFVISATSQLLSDKGELAIASKGVGVRNIYIGCAAISMVAELLAFISAIAPYLLVITAIASLIQLVALFKYIGFLGKAAKALQS